MPIEAALDIGSNSVKLLVLDIEPGGAYRVLHEGSTITGLASGLTPGAALNPERVAQTMTVLRHYLEEAAVLGATRVLAAGTSALRDAGDGPDFLAKVRQELNLDVRILSGEEEARLGRAVALRELPPGSPDVIFFDIGGGSTELTLLHGEAVLGETSLQLGARRATDHAALTQPVTAAADAVLQRFIRERLEQGAPVAAAAAPRIAGLGGTASTAVWMLAGQRGASLAEPHGAVLTLTELEVLLAATAPLTLEELKAWPNLNPERAPVIYAGISIIAALLRHYGADRFTLLDRGLRYGLLLAR
jgi:exopolyphosphatase/guanosine-5'-triphosphate,3'-diphosphate pyrophosphatase